MARPLQITDNAILAALAACPEATSAEVAERLGIGQSTAAKRLAALEAAGSVRRIPGGRDAGRRAPDRWSAAASQRTPQDAEPASGAQPGDGDASAASGETSQPEGHAAGTAGRLGRGALESLVRDFLAARPEESFGPTAVGKALGRSQGAVSNSLSKMAASGEVVLVGDKPRRYRVARSR